MIVVLNAVIHDDSVESSVIKSIDQVSEKNVSDHDVTVLHDDESNKLITGDYDTVLQYGDESSVNMILDQSDTQPGITVLVSQEEKILESSYKLESADLEVIPPTIKVVISDDQVIVEQADQFKKSKVIVPVVDIVGHS